MKRIALMTWHHAENYGTAYQAYALKSLIEDSGAKVDLVLYSRKGQALGKRSVFSLFIGFMQRLKSLCSRSKYNVFEFKDDTFKEYYNKNFNYTYPCESNQEFERLNSIYDGYVCGSDQIWGPEWFDGRYFLDFVHNPNRLIAYAPSIGVSEAPKGVIYNRMKTLIERFPNISIREATGCKVVSQMLENKPVLNVLDPVLMLPADIWSKLEEPTLLPQKSYCFIFFLANNHYNIKKAMEFAKSKGLEPCVFHCTQTEDTPFANTPEQTPGQLLTFIRNAEYVCTDSFHFTVLSLIYKRNFTTFRKFSSNYGVSKNNRITDLLSRFGLQDREYEVSNQIGSYIDYDTVDRKITVLRQQSLSYLYNAIDNLPPLIDESEQLKCWSVDKCNGCQSKALTERSCKEKGIKLKLMNIMGLYPFMLEEKCYRCNKYHHSSNPDGRKPLFYEDLQHDLYSNKNIYSIFKEYYLAFYIKDAIKK